MTAELSLPATTEWLLEKAAIIGSLLRRTSENLIRMGLELAEVKDRIQPGGWEKFLREYTPWSPVTAWRLIQMALRFPDGFQIEKFDPPALSILTQLNVPPAAFEKARELYEQGHQITAEQAKKIVALYRPEPPIRTHVRDDYPHLLYLPDGSVRAASMDLEIRTNPDGDPLVTVGFRGTEITETRGTFREALAALDKRAEEIRPTVAAIDPEPHREWAATIGAAIAGSFDLKGDHVEEMRNVAVAEMVRKSHQFDEQRAREAANLNGKFKAGEAFRGWSHPSIQSECRRAAEQLRNGGTYRTRREKGGSVVARFEEADE
jgi:hypothetical protein